MLAAEVLSSSFDPSRPALDGLPVLCPREASSAPRPAALLNMPGVWEPVRGEAAPLLRPPPKNPLIASQPRASTTAEAGPRKRLRASGYCDNKSQYQCTCISMY